MGKTKEQNKAFEEIEKEVKRIHRDLCVLDARIRKATHDKVGLIDAGSPWYENEIISVYDGVIELSTDKLERLRGYDERLLSVEPQPDPTAYIITGHGETHPLEF